jgi:hypothetical protein
MYLNRVPGCRVDGKTSIPQRTMSILYPLWDIYSFMTDAWHIWNSYSVLFHVFNLFQRSLLPSFFNYFSIFFFFVCLILYVSLLVSQQNRLKFVTWQSIVLHWEYNKTEDPRNRKCTAVNEIKVSLFLFMSMCAVIMQCAVNGENIIQIAGILQALEPCFRILSTIDTKLHRLSIIPIRTTSLNNET